VRRVADFVGINADKAGFNALVKLDMVLSSALKSSPKTGRFWMISKARATSACRLK